MARKKVAAQGIKPELGAEIDQFGVRAHMEITAGLTARDGLWPRWRKLWAMYRDEPTASGVTVIPEMPAEHVPLMSPKIRRVVDATVQSIFGVSPIVNALDCEDNDCADVLAKQYDSFMSRMGLRRIARQAVESAAVVGLGIVYHPYMSGSGFECYSILPEDFFVTPTVGVLGAKEAMMIGHRYWISEGEYISGCETGRFLDRGTLPWGTPESTLAARSQGFDMSQSEMSTMEVGNKQGSRDITVYQAFWYGDLEGLEKLYKKVYKEDAEEDEAEEEQTAGRRWWRFIIEDSTRKVLCFEPIPYRPPYTVVRLHDEPTKFWPATSLGNRLQSLQNKYTQLHNMLDAGVAISAFPPIVSSGGKIAEKLKKYTPGDILDSENAVEVTILATPFNADGVLAAIAKVEELAETVAAVPALGTNQNLPSNTTATEAEILASQQSQSETSYAHHVGYAIEELAEYMHIVCSTHPGDVADTYGGVLEEGFIAALTENPRFEAMGKVATRNTQVQMQYYQTLLELSADPTSMLNRQEVIKRFVGTMDIDSTEKLFIEPDQLAGGPLDGGIPGMGGVPLPDPGQVLGGIGGDAGDPAGAFASYPG